MDNGENNAGMTIKAILADRDSYSIRETPYFPLPNIIPPFIDQIDPYELLVWDNEISQSWETAYKLFVPQKNWERLAIFGYTHSNSNCSDTDSDNGDDCENCYEADRIGSKLLDNIRLYPITYDDSEYIICLGESIDISPICTDGWHSSWFSDQVSWSNSASLSDPNSLITTASPVETTVYTLYFSGEETSIQCTVQVVNVIDGIAANSSMPQCYGDSDGSLQAVVFPSNAIVSYLWSNGETTQQINGPAGSYSVTVTDEYGCTETTSFTIHQPNPLTLTNINVTNISCYEETDGQITIEAQGGTSPYSYNWSNGDIINAINGLVGGEYTVTITDDNACILIETFTIIEPERITGYFNSTMPSCNGDSDGSLEVVPEGGTTPFTFEWSTSEITNPITGLSQGTYSVTLTDANNCTQDMDVYLNEPPELIIGQIGATPVTCSGYCDGEAFVVPSGGTHPNYYYDWNDPDNQNTNVATDLCGGTYIVIVTDENGCTTYGSVQINDHTPIAMSIKINDIPCPDQLGDCTGSVEICATGGSGSYELVFDGSLINDNYSCYPTSEIISSLCEGNHTLQLTDGYGCVVTEEIEIGVIEYDISYDITNVCNGQSGMIDITITGDIDQAEPFTYSWNNGAVTEDISGLPPGLYAVEVTDNNGCIENSGLMQVSNSISVSFDEDPGCIGGNYGSINTSLYGANYPVDYLWSNGATTQNISNLETGTYSVTVTDATGCTAVSTVVLSHPFTFDVDVNDECSYFNNATAEVIIDNPLSWDYDWFIDEEQDGTYDFYQNTGPFIDGLSAANYMVYVSDQYGNTVCAYFTIEAYMPYDQGYVDASIDIIGENYYITSNTTIGNGGLLNIEDSKLVFAPNKYIRVSRGELNVTNSRLSSCNELWQGIEENYIDDNIEDNKITINNSTIENAVIAVLSNGGCDVDVKNTTFNNNNNGINIYSNTYDYSDPAFQDKIENCTFITNNDQLDDHTPEAHVTLIETRNVIIDKCSFANTTTEQDVDKRGNGLIVERSDLELGYTCNDIALGEFCTEGGLDGCFFSGLNVGIYVVPDYNIYTTSVKGARFTNNFRAVEFRGTSSLEFKNNVIRQGELNEPWDPINESYIGQSCGVFLNGCTGYTFTENTFHGGSAALQVHNSGWLPNKIYRNRFFNITDATGDNSTAIAIRGTNRHWDNEESGLYLRCNTINGSDFAIALVNGSVKETQGDADVQGQYALSDEMPLNNISNRSQQQFSDFFY